jgi:hypothetical protein
MPDHLTWVREHMPQESAQALTKFLTIDPKWTGAGWDDLLDMMLDADAHLEVTEPLYEFSYGNGLRDMGMLPAAVAITLLYASKAFAEMTADQQAITVKATIDNNGGPNVAFGHVNIVEDMITSQEAQKESVTQQADMWRKELGELDASADEWVPGTLQREKDKVSARIDRLDSERGRINRQINALRYLIGLVPQ